MGLRPDLTSIINRPSLVVYDEHRIRYDAPLLSFMKVVKLRTVAERRHQLQPLNPPILTTPLRDVENGPAGEQTEKQTIEILDVSDCTWFNKLVVLMFGFSLFIKCSILYNFPAAPMNNIKLHHTGADMLTYPALLKALVGQYAILFGLCGFIVVIFASVCLAIRMKALSDSPSSTFWRTLGLDLTPLLRELMWSLLLVSLIIGVVLFDWHIFDGERIAPYYEYVVL